MLSPAAPALSASRLSQVVPLKAEPYSVDGEPFADAEEAWFWAVQAHDAHRALLFDLDQLFGHGISLPTGRLIVEAPPAEIKQDARKP